MLRIKYCKQIFLLSFVFFIILKNEVFAQEEKIDASREPETLLAHLIQIESVSGHEAQVGRFLSQYCRQAGLQVEILSSLDTAYNFTASLYPLSSQKPNIIFQSHLDVVPAGNMQQWQNPPFSGLIKDGEVWGRGAIDCKGVAVMQLFAILNLLEESKKRELPYNVTFLGVSSEETGGRNGAALICEKYLKHLNPVVIFGEGGSGMSNIIPSKPHQIVFGVSVAEKSSLWLKLEAKSKRNGHGAVPPSLYASKKLIRGLIKILDDRRSPRFSPLTRNMFKNFGNLQGGFKGFVIKHANWSIFWPLIKKYFEEGEIFHPFAYNTVVITHLSSSKVASNQIANNAQAILDCRLLPDTDPEKFIKKIRQKLGNRVEISIIDQSPHAKASITTSFYESLKKAILKNFPQAEVLPILFPAGTDNNYYRQHQIPVYGITPTIFSQELMDNVHSVNERIGIKNLQEGITTFSQFLKNVFQM